MKKIFITIYFIYIVIPSSFSQQLNYQTHEYEYDNLNRLTKVVFSNGTIYEYVYDNLGNRTQRNVSEIILTYVPDDAFEQKLIDLGYDDIMDDYVAQSNISGITFLSASNLGISDVTGLQDFIALKTLYLNDNNLSELDVSKNTKLEFFNCGNNTISALNLSSNLLLESLDVGNNRLTTLNISSLSNLDFLSCDNNQLESLDLISNSALEVLNAHYNNISEIDLSKSVNLNYIWIRNNPIKEIDFSTNTKLQEVNVRSCAELKFINAKNGNNQILNQFLAQNSPKLFCVQVDDENIANSNSGVYVSLNVDSQVKYGEDCASEVQLTYVPDDAFEQELINLGFDDVVDNYVLQNQISNIETISLENLGISDLTGIEDFTSLKDIDVGFNQITSMDFSKNTHLINLNCGDNQLTSLDLSKNISLERLVCSVNVLVSLDVSKNLNLKTLTCRENQLTTIDVSKNLNLDRLDCSKNAINEINISYNLNLTLLQCTKNKLTILNARNGNNSNLETLNSQNNPNLICIQVDDETAANNNAGVYANWNTDSQVTYGEDCAVLSLSDIQLSKVSLYPNPTEETLFLGLPDYLNSNVKYSLFDLKGKLISEKSIQVNNKIVEIDVSNLSNGVYLIKLNIEGVFWSSNFIKK